MYKVYMLQQSQPLKVVRAGAGEEEWRKAAHCLAPILKVGYFSFSSKKLLPRGGTTHSGLDPQ